MINKIITLEDIKRITRNAISRAEKGCDLITYKTEFGILTIAVPREK